MAWREGGLCFCAGPGDDQREIGGGDISKWPSSQLQFCQDSSTQRAQLGNCADRCTEAVDIAALQMQLNRFEQRLCELERRSTAQDSQVRPLLLPEGEQRKRGGRRQGENTPQDHECPMSGPEMLSASSIGSPRAAEEGHDVGFSVVPHSRKDSAQEQRSSNPVQHGLGRSRSQPDGSPKAKTPLAPELTHGRSTQPRTNADMDPYNHMWSAAKLESQRMFDHDHLKSIYDKPKRKTRHNALLFGSGVIGLISMPFGPIGMALGGMAGALMGGIVGVILDKRRRRAKLVEMEAEKRRLKSLVRWATERLDDDDEILKLIEMVCLEFKPMADIADGSQCARKLLKLLDTWVAQKNVSHQLWVYMDSLLQQWRDLSRGDFIRRMLVLQTLVKTYEHSKRMLDPHEVQFLDRMKRLLSHEAVMSVMAHQQQHTLQGDKRVMECMVYADAENQRNLGQQQQQQQSDLLLTDAACGSPSMASRENSNDGGDLEADASGDSEDEHAVTPYRNSLVPQVADSQRDSGVCKVLKKPFFKNWTDFMDFDSTFKHKMPITLSEFELLLQKEEESTTGWDVCVDRKEIRVAKVQSGVGGVTLRAWGTVPGVDLHVAFYLFYDIEQRMKWDKVFGHMAIIDADFQGSDILYSLLKVPGVTQRDFLQYRRVRIQDDGSILIVLRSAEHPDAPEDKRYIRAESHISGYILRQEFEGSMPVLRIFLMSCSDVKGMIPKWIISYFAPKKPGEWIDSLKKAAVDYQAEHPDFKEALMQNVQKHAADNPYDFEAEDGDGHRVLNNTAQVLP